MVYNKEKTRLRRSVRTRAKLRAVGNRPRLSVFRSRKGIYAQVIDDAASKTLAAASDREIAEKERAKMSKVDRAKKVGEMVAERAKKKKVSKIVFDKGSFRYHGRVKALADAAREGGLDF